MGTVATDLNQLHFFVQVSKTHSFTQAARRLGVPKSSVSRAISSLEGRLGVRLLERTTRSVALTEAGELYLDHCRRVMEEAELADLAMGALQARPRGRLRVGAPIAFAQLMLAPVLGEFLLAYPELQLNLQLLNGKSIPREGGLDVVISAGPLEDSGVLVKPLMKIRLGIYASPEYLKAYRRAQNRSLGKTASLGKNTGFEKITDRRRTNPAGSRIESPADLREHRLITTSCASTGEPHDTTVWRLRRGTELREVRVESAIAVPDPGINHRLALNGAGVAVLGQTMVRDDVAAGRLVRVLPEWEPNPVELHALYPTRLNSSPKVRVFLEFLRDRLGPSMQTHG